MRTTAVTAVYNSIECVGSVGTLKKRTDMAVAVMINEVYDDYVFGENSSGR